MADTGGDASEQPRPAWRRPVLKLSGELLAGGRTNGFDRAMLQAIARAIAEVRAAGVQISVVVGAGNIFRGGRNTFPEIPQTVADDMGMLGTLVNGLALREFIAAAGAPATVLSAVEVPKVADRFTVRGAEQLLADGHALILAGGTGNPFFTTDTAAALRAAELRADVLLKGTNVDGVYSDDPRKNPEAVRYEALGYQQVLVEDLRVMDATAITLCREAGIPIVVFDLKRPGQLARVVRGEAVGTIVGGKR